MNLSFMSPYTLLALLAVPLVAFLYWTALRQGRGGAVALHPDLALLEESAAAGRRWPRHVPAALFLAALAAALVAAARPVAPLPVPDNRTTIMLAIDVSLSMNARDVRPTRLRAAQDAAETFVRALPAGLKVGLASFAGYSVLDVPPTSDHQQVIDAIERLELGRGTAIAAGLWEALYALPERGQDAQPTAASKLPPAAIVYLSDGRNNRPGDPAEAAADARARQVKVYTVGLGTDNGQIDLGGGGFFVGFDRETLQMIARTTGGDYFEASSAGQLSRIYRGLGRSIGWVTKPGEVSGVAAAAAGVLLLLSLAASEATRRVV